MQNRNLSSISHQTEVSYTERSGQENRISVNQHLLELIDFGTRASLSQWPRILLLSFKPIIHGRENLGFPELPLA